MADAGDGEEPGELHLALSLSLAYLSTADLVVAESVSRSFRSATVGDPSLWRRISVDLSRSLEDDELKRLVARAQGKLESLRLVACQNVTASQLIDIAESNPGITEIYFSVCHISIAISILEVVERVCASCRKLEKMELCGLPLPIGFQIGRLLSIWKQHCSGQSVPANDDVWYPIDVRRCVHCSCRDLAMDKSRPGCRKDYMNVEQLSECKYCTPPCADCHGPIDVRGYYEHALCCECDVCLQCYLQLPKCSKCDLPYCSSHKERFSLSEETGGRICQECLDDFYQ